jgi:alpha-glucosidase
MITNTELEFKGDLYPSKIVSFKHDDSVYFNSDNSVVLKVTVIRDSLIRFRYTTKDILVMISLMRLIKIMRMDIIFLKLLVKKIIIKYKLVSKMCYSKADMRVSILIYTELFYLKMNGFSLGRKLRTWR